MDQIVKRAPNSTQQVTSSGVMPKHRGRKFTWKKLVTIIVVIVVIAALAACKMFVTDKNSFTKQIQGNQYQAVFLTNGQVYFGKIKSLTKEGYSLRDIYYLQVKDGKTPDTQAPADKNQSLSLAKLGSELHGPDDAMYIQSNQVLFWENLKNDSQVVKAISEQQKK